MTEQNLDADRHASLFGFLLAADKQIDDAAFRLAGVVVTGTPVLILLLHMGWLGEWTGLDLEAFERWEVYAVLGALAAMAIGVGGMQLEQRAYRRIRSELAERATRSGFEWYSLIAELEQAGRRETDARAKPLFKKLGEQMRKDASPPALGIGRPGSSLLG